MRKLASKKSDTIYTTRNMLSMCVVGKHRDARWCGRSVGSDSFEPNPVCRIKMAPQIQSCRSPNKSAIPWSGSTPFHILASFSSIFFPRTLGVVVGMFHFCWAGAKHDFFFVGTSRVGERIATSSCSKTREKFGRRRNCPCCSCSLCQFPR